MTHNNKYILYFDPVHTHTHFKQKFLETFLSLRTVHSDNFCLILFQPIKKNAAQDH